ncbi:hypothetical protein [Leucobacter iarius]
MTPSFADDAASTSSTPQRLTGKLVAVAASGYAGLLNTNASAAGFTATALHLSPTKADALTAAAVYETPAIGEVGDIRTQNPAGGPDLCISWVANGAMQPLVPCDGSAAQQVRLTANGTLATPDGTSSMRQYYNILLQGPTGLGPMRFDLDQLKAVFSASVQSVDLHARTADLTGHAVPGSTVILNDSTEITVGEDGTWSYTITGLKLGKNTIKVEQYEGENNKTGDTTVDVELNVAPITATAAFLPDVTKNLTISGVAQAGANIEIWQGTKMLKVTPAAAITGAFSTDLTAPNAGGKQTYTIKQVIDGETAATTFDVTADFGAAALIETPLPDAEHNGGALRFQGRGVGGGQISLKNQAGTEIGTATVLANGIWTIDAANIPATDGIYTATQTGKGNNVTTASVHLNPGVTNEKLDVATPARNGRVNAGTITFTGTSNPNAKIELRSIATGDPLGTTTADSKGDWSVDVNKNLGAGTYTIRVVNGSLTEDRSFTAVNPVVDQLDVKTPAAGGTPVAPGTVTFTGTANAGAKIELKSVATGDPLGTTTANAAGNWSVDVNKQLTTEQVYTIRVVNGTKQVDRTFTVKKPSVTEELTVTGPATGTPVAPGTVTFTGTANAGAKIELKSIVTNMSLGTTTADGNGDWSVDVNKRLDVAMTYTIRVVNGGTHIDHTFQVR